MANIPKTGQTTNPDAKTNRFPLTWIHLVSGVVLIAAIALLAWLDANNGEKYDYWIYLSLVVIAYYCYQIPRTAHKEGRVEK